MSKVDRDSSELEVLITFLQRTKDGDYAVIEESSLEYVRFELRREDFDDCEQYYYSLR